LKMTFCDIPGCKEEAYYNVDVCMGYTDYTEGYGGRTQYEPYEKAQVYKRDLCEKHHRKWCESTYNFFKKERKLDEI